MSSLTSNASMESSARDLVTASQLSHASRVPLTNGNAAESYYHQAYPLSTPGVDFILASSDIVSCRFAISSTKLAFQPEVFSRIDRAKIQVYAGLPLIMMDGSKEVIEIILACLDPSLVPDLSHYKFDDLVSALEAVASRSALEHVERLCLLALGAFYKLKPIHVFALAEIYGCAWMAKLASEFTLALDIDLPQHKRLLSIEAYDALDELHSYRRKQARQILNRLRLPLISHRSQCNPDQLAEIWKSSLGRIKRAAWNSPADLDMRELFSKELNKASDLLQCTECLHSIYCLVDQADQEFKMIRCWALPTSNVSTLEFPYPFGYRQKYELVIYTYNHQVAGSHNGTLFSANPR
ncbi:uncharacterized protein MELLADRAFT_112334 [Melampsora larici-populina 98AG31]|uniref:BTB domain-containing protein n=1 Tax=Melampsora larici-populina (strain 98AG31 / pathotype 3-4-7) TaxID=747676 RepID=F4S655_MELLP|nr:uncharacterized protein MELLADRAFT_112334 [Melampsora larici-populina 98AG31]EGF99875.1 hypothetical protein MELLADRAFT_112334 [Melampsora larici-populina 98AG31]